MTWLIKQIAGAAGPYIIGALAALLVMLAATVGVQTWRLDRADAKARQLATDLSRAGNANAALMQTIDALHASNEQWERKCAVNAADARAAANEIAALRARLQQQSIDSRAERQQIYDTHPDAAAWAATAVPDAVAERLRAAGGAGPD